VQNGTANLLLTHSGCDEDDVDCDEDAKKGLIASH